MKRHHETQRVFNDFSWGGYLIATTQGNRAVRCGIVQPIHVSRGATFQAAELTPKAPRICPLLSMK